MTTTGEPVGTDLFRPVRVDRASGDVVRQIKEAIREGRLRPGDGLPSERELTKQFGVSRVTIRDALRTLEAIGLVEIRVGARGGAFITVPQPTYVGEGLANMLLLSDSSSEQVTEARMVFELATIPLVCERRTDEDLAALEDICARSEKAFEAGDFDVRLSTEFHIRLAACAQNMAVSLILDSIQGPIIMSLAKAKDVDPLTGTKGVKEHRALVEAIRKRDADEASAILHRHLGRTAARLHGDEQELGEDVAKA